MSRTFLFQKIRKALREIAVAQRAGWSDQELREFREIGQDARQAANSRRRFLKQSALAAMVPVANELMPIPFRSPASLPSSKADPVLILGAGAAGLAAAYTLKKAGVPFQILEASQRVGGRIYTQFGFTKENQFIERGAELVDSNHETLISLAHELGLEIEDFTAGDAGVEPELFYFNGVIRKEEEFLAGLKPFAGALQEAKSNGAKTFTFEEKNSDPRLSKWDQMSIAEFLQTLRGRVDPWIIAAVGVAYLGEMGRELDEQSSLNLLGLMDSDLSDGFSMFGESDESKRVKGGNGRLPMRLAEEIRRGREDSILLDATVVSIRKKSSGLLVTYEKNRRLHEIKASQVICAIPFTTLRHVEGIQSLGLSNEKLLAIQQLGYGQNTKMMLEFRNRAWRKSGDLAPASTGMIYADFQSQSFWETSRLQPGSHGILTNFLGGRAGLGASRELILARALPDIGKVHPRLVSLFEKGVVQNWNRIPTALGSYTCLKPGQYGLFNGAQGTPEVNGRLIFAGEHASEEFSGFMNGAYDSGVVAANEILKSRGMAAPKAKGA